MVQVTESTAAYLVGCLHVVERRRALLFLGGKVEVIVRRGGNWFT